MQRLLKNVSWLVALLIVVGMTIIFRPGSESFIGSLESTDHIVTTEASGLVSRIHVSSGEHVRKGQVLIELSDINLDILINETEFTLRRLKAERRIARGMVENPPPENQNPVDIEIDQLERDLRLKREKKKAQIVTALQDGVVGSIDIMVGQHVAAFQSLMTFYSPNPRLVNGFLHDTAILELVVGQEVIIQSAGNPMKRTTAKVVSIGERYTNFPVRLKPAFSQTEVWGQEVNILMPENHKFLPSEKVNISAPSSPYGMLKKGFSVAIGSR